MVYLFIDESGDTGNPAIVENSKDFSLAACVCGNEDIDHLITQVKRLNTRLKKKEIKFSKLSAKEKIISKEFLRKLSFETYTTYSRKTLTNYGGTFLRNTFEELVSKINTDKKGKVKVFMDGTENAHFRKIYEPIIRKRFPKAVLQFANSIKTPLIQVADFYAGQRRKSGK